jgi:hypothetical protein
VIDAPVRIRPGLEEARICFISAGITAGGKQKASLFPQTCQNSATKNASDTEMTDF